jgi:hypothetical protein
MDDLFLDSEGRAFRSRIFKAMDEYAKHVHFEFKKWVNEIVSNPKHKKGDYKMFTDEQLFNIFMQEVNM